MSRLLEFLMANFTEYVWTGFHADGADFGADTLRYRMYIEGALRHCCPDDGTAQHMWEETLAKCRLPRDAACCMSRNFLTNDSPEVVKFQSSLLNTRRVKLRRLPLSSQYRITCAHAHTHARHTRTHIYMDQWTVHLHTHTHTHALPHVHRAPTHIYTHPHAWGFIHTNVIAHHATPSRPVALRPHPTSHTSDSQPPSPPPSLPGAAMVAAPPLRALRNSLYECIFSTGCSCR